MPAIKNKAEKVRFAVVGFINTAIDFGLFLSLSSAGLSAIYANYVSTSTAFIFSFFANRHFTFRNSETSLKRQIFLFIVVTLFGVWVLQPLAITLIQHLTNHLGLRKLISLVVSKLAATAVSLCWNYLTYSRYVFKSRKVAVNESIINL